MLAIAVIPARGGSVRVPQKNLQEVGGLALVARAARAARQSNGLSRVFVSTEDPKIAAAAAAEGAETVWRPPELCGDDVPVEAALLHALETIQAHGLLPEVVAMLSCTAPFTHPADIDGTLEALEAREADTAFAAVECCPSLWQQRGPYVRPLAAAPRTAPGREHRFRDAGSVYAMRVSGFREAKSRFFGRTVVHSIDEDRHFVIRTPADLDRARRIAGEVTINLHDHPTVYVDVDETICITPPDRNYENSVPIPQNIDAINRLFERGHRIVYWTARGGKSGRDWTDLTRSQLDRWGARHHGLLTGKPSYDLLICDKALSRVPPG